MVDDGGELYYFQCCDVFAYQLENTCWVCGNAGRPFTHLETQQEALRDL